MKYKKIWIVLCLFLLSACSKPSIDESVLGQYVDSIYINNYFEFNIKLNPSWDVQLEKEFDESTISTSDLMAQKDSGFSSIHIVVKKLKEIEDETALVERYKDEIQRLIKKNITVESIEIGNEILGNANHPYILTKNIVEYDDKTVDVYEKQFIIKKEDYIAIVTLATYHNDETEKLVSLFM